jgi:hypothetical protein
MSRLVILGFTALLLGSSPDEAGARGRFSLELFGGTSFSFSSTLTVRQDGEEPIEVDADWETRPLEQPFYWMLRAGYRFPSSGWELQLLHHKLYLSNPPPEVERLEITHGFNILTINYARRNLPVILRGGAGIVLPHMEAVVRGKEFWSSGYRITGPAFLAGVGKELPLSTSFFVNFEGQFTVAWATVKTGGGEAETMNGAIHLLVGVGGAF